MPSARAHATVALLTAFALGHCGGNDSSSQRSSSNDGGSASGDSSGGSSGSSSGGASGGSSGGSAFGGGSSGGSNARADGGNDAGATCAVCDKANACCKAMIDGGACSDYSSNTCDLAPSDAYKASTIAFCQTEIQNGKAQSIAACN